MSVIGGVALAVLGIYVVALGGLYGAQRSLMFAPDQTHVRPAELGLSSIDETVLQGEQGDLVCWRVEAEPDRPTLLFFHGNAGSVATREAIFRTFMARGYGLFMLGYPGYGASDGSPSERGFVEGARLAYEHLRKSGLQARDIVIYGQSLGTSVAVQLAAEVDARALVLMAPMSSVRAMAKQRYPFVPMQLLLRDPFLTSEFIGSVDEPVLILHGDHDEAVPPRHGQELFDLATEPKTLHIVEGGGHNDLYEFPVVDVVTEFLARYP